MLKWRRKRPAGGESEREGLLRRLGLACSGSWLEWQAEEIVGMLVMLTGSGGGERVFADVGYVGTREQMTRGAV